MDLKKFLRSLKIIVADSTGFCKFSLKVFDVVAESCRGALGK